MKITFIKNKNELVVVVLLGLSAFFGLVILIKTGGFLVTSFREGMLIKKAIAQSSLDPNDAEKYFANSKALAEELKKKNIFELPKPNPGGNISGILGDEILINGRWCKVGDKVEDAEILAIEPTQVKIRWNGQETYFSPMGVVKVAEPQKPVETKRVVQAQGASPTEGDPLGWMGVKLSEKARAKLLEKWNSLSDEEKKQFKEKWNKMSDEQKQQAVEA